MPSIRYDVSKKEASYDQDGCIDLLLMNEPETENRVYWLKEKGGDNLLVQDCGDANIVIDRLPKNYVIRGVMYHNHTLMLADGSGKNRNYKRESSQRYFKRDKSRNEVLNMSQSRRYPQLDRN